MNPDEKATLENAVSKILHLFTELELDGRESLNAVCTCMTSMVHSMAISHDAYLAAILHVAYKMCCVEGFNTASLYAVGLQKQLYETSELLFLRAKYSETEAES